MVWDLNSNQMTQIAAHDAPIKTIHHIKASNYTCVMTGGWDKTLKVSAQFYLSTPWFVCPGFFRNILELMSI